MLAGLAPALLPASATAGACGITGIAMSDLSPGKDGADVAARRTTTKDVGQETTLSADPTAGALAPGATASYHWIVGGDAIRDYTDVVASRNTTVGSPPVAITEYVPTPFAVTGPDAVDGAGNSIFDTTAAQLTFYFRMAVGPLIPVPVALPSTVPVTVELREQHAGDAAPHACATATTDFTVERNASDRERQPEDYYVEINHGRRVFSTHEYWHTLHNPDSSDFDGADFLTFHRGYLTGYDRYRETFGYPAKGVFVPLAAFAPVPPLEAGYTLDHAPRENADHADSSCHVVTPAPTPFPTDPGSCAERPTWLRRAAVNPSVVTPENVDPFCMPLAAPAREVSSLEDFGTDRSVFGCMLEFGWHGGPHVDIGGDMGDPSTAHRDPIFWRWHGFADQVYGDFLSLTGLPSSRAVLAGTVSAAGRCMGLEPTITGTRRGDVLRGTAGRDVIAAGGGDDVIRARGGNDVICAGRGDDRVFAGDGEDDVLGRSGEDVIRGQGAADGLSGGKGDDRLIGGRGADRPDGGSGDDVVAGGSGGEWMMFGGPGDDRMRGGPGNDHLHGGFGNDRLVGGPGDDGLIGAGGDDALDGGAGHDHASYIGSPRGIEVDLGEGSARGHGADDLDGVEGILGSSFDDMLEGGHHPEELEGGFGDDRIDGGGGGDTLRGGEDRDVVSGEGGPDFCVDTESEESCAESAGS